MTQAHDLGLDPFMNDALAQEHYAKAVATQLAGETFHWLGPDRVVYTVQPTPESLAEEHRPCDCEGCGMTYGGMR